MKTRLPLALLALLITVAGCGNRGSTAGSGGDGSGLRGRTFLSTAITENGQPHQLVAQTRVRFQFTDDGRLIADAGCNTVSGTVSLADGRITVSDLGATGVGCEQPLYEQDSWLTGLLGGRPSWRLDGDDLVVSTASTELTMRDRKVAEPDLALQGTRWTLDTILDGQTAGTSPAASAASLVFDGSTVTVATGCNNGSAGYRVSGDTITFDPVITTKLACAPDKMAVENAVVGLLNGPVSYKIDSNRLTLTSSSGKGISLRGQK